MSRQHISCPSGFFNSRARNCVASRSGNLRYAPLGIETGPETSSRNAVVCSIASSVPANRLIQPVHGPSPGRQPAHHPQVAHTCLDGCEDVFVGAERGNSVDKC